MKIPAPPPPQPEPTRHADAYPSPEQLAEATGVRNLFPCPACGEPALTLLGETRHSLVFRCAACNEVSVRRRA